MSEKYAECLKQRWPEKTYQKIGAILRLKKNALFLW